MKTCVFLLALIAGIATGWGQTPAPDAPLSPRSLLPAPPVRSGDGSIIVRSSMAMEEHRAPVLMFVSRAREELFRSMRMESSTAILEVIIGNQRDGDTRVLSGRVRLSGGKMGERIELPDPEAADLALLKRSVWMALYRSWLVSVGRSEAVLEQLPAWLVEGAVRRMDPEAWLADVDRSLHLWSRAYLPPAAALLDTASPVIALEPALGVMMASYLMDRRVLPSVTDLSGDVPETFIREVAKGQAWSVERIAELVMGQADVAALDKDFDKWCVGMGRKVLIPGLTTEGTVRRFRSSLLICPSDYGKVFNQKKPWMTFQELAASNDLAMKKRAATAQMFNVKIAGAGRDGTLLALAEAYSQFLAAVAEGKKPKALNVLLMNAEAQRKGLEDALAGGQVFQD